MCLMHSSTASVKELFVLLFVALFADQSVLSENSSGLKGTVIYKVDHAPIRGAYVLLRSNDGKNMQVRAGENGGYFVKVPPGIYDVLVGANGFSPTCRKIKVDPDGMMVFNAVLDANNIEMEE
jgi:hypothetical protein